MKKHLYLISVISVAIGTLIYCVWRTDIVFLDWIGVEGNVVSTYRHPLLYWIVYCLPDGLWYMALLCLQKSLYNPSVVWSKIVLYCAILLPFILEFGQLLNWLPGTFDKWDMITYLLTLFIFVLLCKRKKSF